MENLIGVVLCGGESKRMGSDKGLMQKNEKSWASIIAEKLSAQQIPVFVSINKEQEEAYAYLFSSDQLVIDHIHIKGPLTGLLSVHSKYPGKDILLMACDLIDMDDETISQLITKYRTAHDHDFIVYHDQFAEPFCAIYKASGIAPLVLKAKNNSLSKFSFQSILDEGKTLRMEVTNKTAFKNYNTISGHHQAL